MIGWQKKKVVAYEESDSYHVPSRGIEYEFESSLWSHSKGGWLVYESRSQVRRFNLCQGRWEIEMDDRKESAVNQVFARFPGHDCQQDYKFLLLFHVKIGRDGQGADS